MVEKRNLAAAGSCEELRPRAGLAAASFNFTLVAHVTHALASSGFDAALKSGLRLESVDLDAPAMAVLESCLSILRDCGAISADGNQLILTQIGNELFEAKGFFTWLIGGYSAGLSAMTSVLSGHPADIRRNDKLVAIGSAQVDEAFIRRRVREVLLRLNPRRIVDLGCGDASRLVSYIGATEGTSGIGIEKAPEAAALAESRVRERGLSSRIRIAVADCLAPAEQGQGAEDADCVMSFFLLHDLLQARQGNLDLVLEAICANYPIAHTFLLADTTSDDWHEAFDAAPVFARGFELMHALMGIRLRTLAEYESLFKASAGRLIDVIPLGVPNSWLFHFELP